MDINL